MRVILVPVADRPECARALRIAFKLGQQLDANVSGCHIRAHRRSGVSLPLEITTKRSDEALWQSASKGKSTAKSSAAAKTLFADLAESFDYALLKRPGVSPGALWAEKVGSPDKVLANMGPVSDLTVVSRPASNGGKLASLFVRAALFNTGKPVLVLPQSGKTTVGEHISIAWNQSKEAAQAVAAAMPLLQNAAQVSIITSGPESGVGPKASQLAAYLKSWGVKADKVTTKRGKDSEMLLKTHRELNADLMVMGAYSRSRVQELVFGGVTQTMLNKANIPLFMLHV